MRADEQEPDMRPTVAGEEATDDEANIQVLQKRWDPTFSAHSHGFRPGHSAQQAVHEAQQYIAEGHRWVVDLDLDILHHPGLQECSDQLEHSLVGHTLGHRRHQAVVIDSIEKFLVAPHRGYRSVGTRLYPLHDQPEPRF